MSPLQQLGTGLGAYTLLSVALIITFKWWPLIKEARSETGNSNYD